MQTETQGSGADVRPTRPRKYTKKSDAQAAIRHLVRAGLLARPDRCFLCREAATPRNELVACPAGYESLEQLFSITWICRRCHRAQV